MDCLRKGVSFNSQTDTEVIAKLVEEKISQEKLRAFRSSKTYS